MFTKKTIDALLKSHKNQNFIINTNEGEGHGINGISFNSYAGYREWEDRDNKRYIKNVITEVAEDYIVIKQEDHGDYCSWWGITEHIIPMDTITSITFIVNMKRYPTYLS